MKEIFDKLAASAKEARTLAYSPYSGVTVGAALLSRSGKLYLGANVENASFSLTECAERVAMFKAITDGEREFEAIAISGGKTDCKSCTPFPPCGACRQVLAEFCSSDMPVILVTGESYTVHKLSELLPLGFDKDFL